MFSKDFREFLERIYGKMIVDGLLEKDSLKFKDIYHLVKFINNFQYDSEKRFGCQLCKQNYNLIKPGKKNFGERNMDFPSWLGDLKDYNHINKELMIIGESVTNSFKVSFIEKPNLFLDKKRKINIAFELGTRIRDKSNLTGLNPKGFWSKISNLFLSSSDNWLNKLYITDMAKCNCQGKKILYLTCALRYLIKEILFISPKFILILGHNARIAFIPIIQASKEMEIHPKKINISLGYYSKQDIFGGHIMLKDHNEKYQKMIDFLSIPHTSKTSPKYQDIESVWKPIGEYLQKNFPKIFT
ncbi:MAG: hypothetical protein ACTSVV_12905 [Promethearchaeota archaeon]